MFSYFILQYFFTQLFYSKYNAAILFLIAAIIFIIIMLISKKEEEAENLLESLAFFYYAALVLLIKRIYRKVNSFLVTHKIINDKFSSKGFTYVSYHKGIFDRGNSWDRDLATNPSWLDHTFSWILILIPLIVSFLSIFIYRNSS